MFTFEQFYDQIQQEIRDRAIGEVGESEAEGRQPDFKENTFTELMLEYLEENGIGDNATVCHYASKTPKGSIKLNAWAVDEEEGVATVCVTLFRGTPSSERVTKTEVDQVLDRATRAFEQAVSGWHEKMEQASEASRLMEHLYERRADIVTASIVLLTDALLPGELKNRRERKGPYTFRYDCWDLQRLYRLQASNLPYESVEIDLQDRFGSGVPCLPPKQRDEDHAVYLAVIPGTILCELYDEFGSQLLDLNVRSFLQARGKVNKGIRDTLCKEASRFLAYNNGISATAERVDTTQDNNGGLVLKSLKGFQVVNGGQTMASIHRAAKIDKADISSVFVQAKITVVEPDRIEVLAPLISRYANSQNRVSDADFSSNDPYNVELQHLSERVWAPGEQNRWFYERTRGQYQVQKAREGPTIAKAKQFESKCPSSQRFTKTDMAKYINCWKRRPHIVSLGAQKNFVAFMDELREPDYKDWKPDEKYYKELIAKGILFKAADKAARAAGIQAYKANIVAYMVALLSEKSLDRLDLVLIWQAQAAPAWIIEAFSQWAEPVRQAIVQSAGPRNVTEWCKKEACWKSVCSARIPIPEALKKELEQRQPLPTVGKAKGHLDSIEQENIARTMQLNAKDWFQLSEWGRKRKRLKDWQCGIALTLAGYAQGGWEKVPSAKQAKQAVSIIKIAEEEGALRGNG